MHRGRSRPPHRHARGRRPRSGRRLLSESRLGTTWRPGAGITWFRTSGTWLGLFGYADLAADVGLRAEQPTAYRGITLALNFGDERAVDEALAQAVAAGARLVKPASRAEWGGYSGYFADPDGHLWEAAFAPGFPVSEDGTIEITD